MTVELHAVESAGPCALAVPANARGFNGLYDDLPLGVYDAFRTYGKVRFLELDQHLARLAASIRRLGWNYELDETRLRRCLHAVCSQAPFEEMRVRIDVLKAPARSLGTHSRELIALAAFAPPPAALYRDGVPVLTTDALVRHDPLAKTADFVEARRAIERAHPQAYEHLIREPGGGLPEGFSSNFYLVKDGELLTAGEGVLEGVTRRLVLDRARDLGIPVRLRTPQVDDLADATEAAISSASRGLVPVVRIDDAPVGDGRPGAVISGLSEACARYVDETCRPAI